MARLKEIDIDILPKEVKKELIDFYEYLLTKYGKKNLKLKSPINDKKVFFEFVKKHAITLPKDYKFNREELHER
ncbi:MAG: hypothetical protein HY752_00335 [Nitrospirae bacterium]|nr:hypothetical protein [Nitrospirota bacterium]